MLVTWIALLGVGDAAASDDLPVRLLHRALVGEGVAVDPDVVEKAQAEFEKAVEATWPEAVKAGKKREQNRVSADADPIVHVGLRLSRFELDRFEAGGEKTLEVLRATVAPYAVDLGTGEVLTSAPFTWLATAERKGVGQRVSDRDKLIRSLVSEGVPRAVERFAEAFQPDRLVATVLSSDRQGAWIARGRLDGGFVGERFRGDKGGILEVVERADRVSRVVPIAGAKVPKEGAEIAKPGLARPLGAAPRVLVVPPTRVPALAGGGGPDAESVAMWTEEALAQSGWVVVPRGNELLGSQIRESARIDIPQEQLLNAQSPPDRVAVPRIWRLASVTSEERKGQGRVEAWADLQVDIYDAQTGVLLQSIASPYKAEHDTSASLTEVFAQTLLVSSVKDAAAVLPAQEGARPAPPLPLAVVEKASDVLRWEAKAAPLPIGVIGEVHRIEERFSHPATGEDLGGPLELQGVARVVRTKGKWLEAAWVAPGSAKRDDVFVPVGGKGGVEPMRVVIDEVTAEGLPDLHSSAEAGLHVAPGLVVVASGAEAEALDDVAKTVSRSGFAGRIERAPIETDRELHVRMRVSVSDERSGKRKQKVSRAVRVDIEAQVLEGGQPVPLKAPSADEAVPTYTMWTQSTLSAKLDRNEQGKNEKALTLDSDAAILPVAQEAVRDAAIELGRRVAVMLGGES